MGSGVSSERRSCRRVKKWKFGRSAREEAGHAALGRSGAARRWFQVQNGGG